MLATAAVYIAMRILDVDDSVPHGGRLTWWQAFGTTTTELEETGGIMMKELARQEASATAAGAGVRHGSVAGAGAPSGPVTATASGSASGSATHPAT